jgi:hypothetical protein
MPIEESEELKRSLQAAFPRLHDLYIASERNHPKSYFEQPNCIAAIRRCDDKLLAIERDLQQLDAKAWLDFKTKTIHLLTTTDRWGWNTELFDRFDEAKGYCFLMKEGYTDIEFILPRQDVRTPDLRGVRQDGKVLLEVKTIHESDDENDRLMRRGKYQVKDNRMAQWVEHFLNDAMQRKLQKTVESATEQLSYPDEKVQAMRTHPEYQRCLQRNKKGSGIFSRCLSGAWLSRLR